MVFRGWNVEWNWLLVALFFQIFAWSLGFITWKTSLISVLSQPGNQENQGINYQGIWKWTLFNWKIREFSGNFDWISGKLGKINTFLEKYFLVIRFLSVLLSAMYIFMFWNMVIKNNNFGKLTFVMSFSNLQISEKSANS